jgi:carbon-monoxide dehydrogenase medium subunit
MYPAQIREYSAPRTLDEVVAALAALPGAHLLAGGQSLMQAIKARLVKPDSLIDLSRVPELKGITISGTGLRIGAMTRYCEIARETRLAGAYEALIDAASHVGDRQVRNRGTIGGSLCWNYIAACMPPTAIGLGAELELVDTSGATRRIAAEAFLKAPLETARRDNEILTAVLLPPVPPRAGSAYRKWGLVADALPVVGVCAFVELDDAGACRAARIAVGGLASGPRRAPSAEAALRNVRAAEPEAMEGAAGAAAREIETQADLWASVDYRKVLVRSIAQDVIARAFARAKGA